MVQFQPLKTPWRSRWIVKKGSPPHRQICGHERDWKTSVAGCTILVLCAATFVGIINHIRSHDIDGKGGEGTLVAGCTILVLRAATFVIITEHIRSHDISGTREG